jgi:hypothetical protein
MRDPACAEQRGILGLGPHTNLLVVISEGATDPDGYEQIVGHPPTYHCPNPGNCTCRSGLQRQ